jgi:acyl-CoA reductase-like NAD-dependent aldehyde dehydrogenase
VPGAFNLVCGTGPVVGEAIAAHAGIDMVSFTGSTRAGVRVAELAAPSVKRVALELGGKSPNIVLDDADLELAVPMGVASAFANAGQACSAQSRMLVPRSLLPRVEELALAAAQAHRPGDPFAEGTTMGPLVSAVQRDRVRGYITTGIEQEAKLLTGGPQPPEGLETGYFVRPTVFSDVTPAMTIAQEEIFGPVLSIMAYDSEEDAVALANDTIYGLSAGVWSADRERAVSVGRRIRTGHVSINGSTFDQLAPFGGCKRSGIGRENGRFGVEEFLEVKTLQL